MREQDVCYRDNLWGKGPYCKRCGSDVKWVECEHCEDGFSGHECGEDVCCCLDPRPNVPCDVCLGEGGWFYCPKCDKEAEKTKGA